MIVDPFAGGSVRGIVANKMNINYWGCDLNKEQILANKEQYKLMFPNSNLLDITPVEDHGGIFIKRNDLSCNWVFGDSEKELDLAPDADLIFSCPPYGSLEKYTDDKDDLSNMPYEEFKNKLRRIINKCYDRLKEDSFAVFVVGEFRNKKTGAYENFVGDTINSFIESGFKYYNEIILVNSVGSLPIRIAGQFSKSRKIGKCHQNVLVFVKGDPIKATSKCIKGTEK